ncbi:MAG: hypothetical protein GEU90_02690 [Gemmatimonas sp.]|nr:hypothetical protein [Gemmatimonas sp.]
MKSSPRARQRQVDLTTAVCQERILAAHVQHVLALVDLIADRVPFDDALDIYVRILRLSPEQARNVGSRALAELGRRDGATRTPLTETELMHEREEQEEEPAESNGAQARADALFSRLRRRVRGRVQEDLRHRISLAAARTEDELLATHVENALLFVRSLDEIDEPEAVELYVDTMQLPEGPSDVIYNRALRLVADQVLPPLPAIANEAALEEAEHNMATGDVPS